MRHRDWDMRLHRAVDELVGEPFRWGETDCASVVIRAVEAIYPPDDVPLPRDQPSYDDEGAALRAHAETGGVGPALEAEGAERVPLAFARSGDVLVGLDPQGGVPGAAVVVGPRYVVASERDGVVERRLRDLREAGGDGVTALRLPGG